MTVEVLNVPMRKKWGATIRTTEQMMKQPAINGPATEAMKAIIEGAAKVYEWVEQSAPVADHVVRVLIIVTIEDES